MKFDAFDGLLTKLGRIARLDADDRDAIRRWPATRRTIQAGEDIIREGQQVEICSLLVSGLAARYKLTESGRRQFVSFHFPGDLLDLQHHLLRRADHSLAGLTNVAIAEIPFPAIRTSTRERPAVMEALWTDTLIDASIFREWVLNVGQRDARARLAHLLCEFGVRTASSGTGRPDSFDFPVTQDQLGSATGLTSVHVNRTLRLLQEDGLLRYGARHVTIDDPGRLHAVAQFDSAYLHGLA